ncbi:SNF2-related protein [Defluviitalea phaphyphila]|uniref:SNF2-related protein n=1 Tax=Defluviitalea phaphyphila TaxID=1473580 RepID=UPI0007316AFA|nr:SNF2-related protein [Defluviitalea phaphyphila]
MGFLKKLTRVLKIGNQSIFFTINYNPEYIEMIPNISLDKDEKVVDLIKMYNIKIIDNKLCIEYEEVYDLYYDENDNEIQIYKKFNLPDLFKGFLKIENVNNFIQDEEVQFSYKFEGGAGKYDKKYGNIVECFSNGDIKILSKDIYAILKQLNEYNSNIEKRKNVASQFEMLRIIKEYAEKTNIILNKRLRDEEKPVIIDKVKIDLKDDGQTLEIIPIFSDNDNVNNEILTKLDQNNDIKDFYSATINGKKVKFVMKNKGTIKTIKKNRKVTGQKRLDILSGDSEIFEDNNIDLSIFGPRVIGLGYLPYRSYPAMSKTSDLKWIEKEIDEPYFFCGSEKVILGPENLKIFENKLKEMNEKGQEKAELNFKTEDGNEVRTTMNKEQIKNEIIKIKNSIVSPTEIKSKNIIKEILEKYDKEESNYIKINGKYIEKYPKEYFKERLYELENKEKSSKKDSLKKMDLLIIENAEKLEYVENDKNTKPVLDEVQIPSLLKKNITLFDYQKETLHKLQNLYLTNSVNGFLLCDDMGLGKTLQLLCFLAWLKERQELTPSLIVAPTSLLNNWDNSNGEGEIQKFFINKAFKTIKVRGRISKEDIENLKDFDIVFTTYESLRMNNKELGTINWNVMICDEAQKIKNPFTKVSIAAKAQNANFKIVCSATPIENTLVDLWNLVDYSKPGLLNSLKEFKRKYVDRAKNAEENELKSINDEIFIKLKDYYIRREKDILPKELPNKKIKIYKRKANSKEKEYINRLIETESSALALIQKMLFISSHIDLLSNDDILNTDAKTIQEKSTKINILYEILKDIKEREEKAIIFARSIKMQHLIYKCIDYWFNIKVNIVNGKITNLDKRKELIDNFREKQGFNVIILSPDVAGFGLTLTEANHVIHYMRLWNPAKEDQATDRVYRIGQDKEVTVYYPMLSFTEDNTYEYNDVREYVNQNIEIKSDNLSPEEKLNILMARKKNMLLNFFLAAENGDISEEEFFRLDNENKREKNIIQFRDIQDNLIDEYEFEALTAVIYEKKGYTTYLTTRSNDNGVDVVCVKDTEKILIQCKKVKRLDSINTIKDLLYAKNVYRQNIGFDYKLIIVTNVIKIPDKIKNYNGIEVIDGNKLNNMLNKYKIYKDEIDIKNNKRYSFERLKFELLHK